MPRAALRPFWTTSDRKMVKLYLGDALETLREMPSRSVHCCITSPPYFGLRDYGTAEWEGGDENCDHKPGDDAGAKQHNEFIAQREGNRYHPRKYAGDCWKCGAKRIDSQIGLEKTPEEFIQKMVEVFREVKRVLRDDGTCWLNLGDSFEQGNQLGTPWRTALALQADGWVLRQDIIWNKRDPMPSSTTSRCTTAHEYIFLLTKSADYYFDWVAIADESLTIEAHENGYPVRNKRSVWTISRSSYTGDHFAVFPEDLVENCILAGTSEYGGCHHCGAPFRRIIDKQQLKRERPNDYVKRKGAAGTGNSCANTVAGVAVNTKGWEPTCECLTNQDYPPVPCTILDPFCGSGTAMVVAIKHGRRSIGIDLNQSYLDECAITRIEGALFTRPALNHLIPRSRK